METYIIKAPDYTSIAALIKASVYRLFLFREKPRSKPAAAGVSKPGKAQAMDSHRTFLCSRTFVLQFCCCVSLLVFVFGVVVVVSYVCGLVV